MRRHLIALATVVPITFGATDPCVYNEHRAITFLGPGNVLHCNDAEGGERCRLRCSADPECAGYGLYVTGPRTGRCCTKRNNDGASAWPAGVSYTKAAPAPPGCPFLPPPTPSASVAVSHIFFGNATLPYNKGAMLETLPGGRLAAAFQAGLREADPGQRVLFGVSPDGGRTWPSDWAAVAPEPAGVEHAQWEPTLFLAPNGTLWCFWSEGPGSRPNLLFAATASADSGFQRWSRPRLLLNATEGQRPPRGYLYPINRVVVAPATGAWLLPCDWGCGPEPTAAFGLISTDRGTTWEVGEGIPGIPTTGLCPEPGMAVVNRSTIAAVVRSAGSGFLQSWSHDGGQSCTSGYVSPRTAISALL